MSDTNQKLHEARPMTRDEFKSALIEKLFEEHLLFTTEIEPFGQGFDAGYDAGLAARSPRDEEAVEEAVAVCTRMLQSWGAWPVEYLSLDDRVKQEADAIRTLLDHVSKSPHPVERGEG